MALLGYCNTATRRICQTTLKQEYSQVFLQDDLTNHVIYGTRHAILIQKVQSIYQLTVIS